MIARTKRSSFVVADRFFRQDLGKFVVFKVGVMFTTLFLFFTTTTLVSFTLRETQVISGWRRWEFALVTIEYRFCRCLLRQRVLLIAPLVVFFFFLVDGTCEPFYGPPNPSLY